MAKTALFPAFSVANKGTHSLWKYLFALWITLWILWITWQVIHRPHQANKYFHRVIHSLWKYLFALFQKVVVQSFAESKTAESGGLFAIVLVNAGKLSLWK